MLHRKMLESLKSLKLFTAQFAYARAPSGFETAKYFKISWLTSLYQQLKEWCCTTNRPKALVPFICGTEGVGVGGALC